MSSLLQNNQPLLALAVILCTGMAVLAGLSSQDYQWTLAFATHAAGHFAQFMNRSVFNGARLPGAGDLLYPPLAIALFLYIPAWLWKYDHRLSNERFHTFLAWFRPLLGFTLMSAFSCALLFTHTVKQIMGRARPDAVFAGTAPFSEWYTTGPLFFTQGSFSGSFPSGHTATASISIIFAYVLLASLGPSRRWIGRCGLACALLVTLAMGTARMMSASHWLTDVVFTLFAQWALIHIIFYFVLKVPEQQAYFRRYRCPEPRPLFFEVRMGLSLLPVCVGIWAFFTGLRSYRFEGMSWLLALAPAGLIWTLVFLRLLRTTLAIPPQPDSEEL